MADKNNTMKMVWRNIAKKPIVLTLILLLVSCRNSKVTGTPTAAIFAPAIIDPVTLLFGVTGSEMDSYTTLAEAFTAENPNIRIQLVSLDGRLAPGDAPDRYRQIAQTTDVFVYNTLDSIGIEQVALELSPWLNASTNFAPDDFYPGLLARGENSVWGVPLASTYYLIYYNKAIFDTAGMDYPAADWTWETFRMMAQALTVPDGDEVAQWGFVPIGLWPLTTTLLDGTPATAMLIFTTDEMMTQVEWLAFLFRDDIPWFDNYGQINAVPTGQLELIGNQKTAMWVDDHTFAWANRRAGISVAPYPSGLLGDGVPMRVQQAAISRGTAYPEAAWLWIDFLSRQAPVGRGVPGRRSVAAATNYWDTLDTPVRTAVQQSVERGIPFTLNSPAQTALDTAVAQIIVGSETVETALQIAQETVAAQLEILSTQLEEPFSVTDPQPETAVEKTTIVFMASDAPYDFLSPYPGLAEAFTVEYPNIDIELRSLVLADENQTYAEMVADVDCFADFAGIVQTNIDLLISVDPLLDNDLTVRPDDFYANSIQPLTYNGSLYGLPLMMSAPIVQYNKALFDEAGLAYPPLNWTLDEFLETAVALTQGEGDERRYAFSFLNLTGLATTALAQFDVSLVDNSVDPATLDFAATAEALRWYTNLVTEYEVMPPPPPLLDAGQLFQIDPVLNLIAADRLAMWQSSTDSNLMAERRSDMEIDETVFPRRSNGRSISSNLSVTALFIRAGSSQPAACWEWFKFLTQSLPVNEGNLPTRTNVATSTAFQSQVGQERMALYEVLLNQANIETANQSTTWGADLWWIIAYRDVVLNNVPVEEALAQRQTRFDLFRACVIDNDALADYEKQQACYREEDPNGMGVLFGE